MLKINPQKFCINIAYRSLFIFIILKMLYPINHNNTVRLLGFLIQAVILTCYIVQEVITLRRKSVNKITITLTVLIVYQCAISIIRKSIYLPYTTFDILIWPLSIIVYYNYAKYNNITDSIRRIAPGCYIVLCVISIKLIAIHLSGNGNIGQVIFPTYFCLTTLPLVILFSKNIKYRNLCIILCVIIHAISLKRAATLAIISGIFFMSLIDAHIQGSLIKKWKRYLYIFLTICLGTIFVIYLDKKIDLQILDRLVKLGTDGGSGRDVIWNIILQAYRESSLNEQLLGHGFQSVYYCLKPGGFFRFAHNSFIEYLYDYGIIGLLILIIFSIELIISEYKLIRRKSRYAPVMGMTLIITMFLGFFSYFFEESNIIQPVAIGYGLLLGLAQKERKSEI